jgi:hypothetical protein
MNTSKHREGHQATAVLKSGGWLNLFAFVIGVVSVVTVLALAMAGGSYIAHAEDIGNIRCLADTNNNEVIERPEAIDVVVAYLLFQNFGGLGRPPTKSEAVDIVTAYLLQIPINCSPTPTPTFTPTRTPTSTATPSPTPKPLEQLAFTSDREGNLDIYTMNSDGSNQTRLTSNTDNDDYPSWAAYGLGIAYSVREDGTWNIHRMDADGANDVRLTSHEIPDQDPDWSPDGSKIAYHERGFSGHPELYVMNSDGTNVVRLTNNVASDGEPSWSPDGRRIAFSSTRDRGVQDIHVMDADGSNVVNLTDFPNQDYDPSWSPDGQLIAFVSQRDGNDEIYVMNADGSDLIRLTNNSASDSSPYWQRGPTSPVVTEVDLNGSGSSVSVDTGEVINVTLKYQVCLNGEPGTQVQIIGYLARENGEVLAGNALEYACLFTGIPSAHPGVQGQASFVLASPSEAGSYTFRVSQMSSADCPTAASHIPEPGREFGSVTVSGPPRLTAFADFSSPDIVGQNFSLIVGPFVRYNTSQDSPDGDSWIMLAPGLSYIQASVNLSSVVQGASLTMIHLSSGDSGAQGGGYSPVDIIINGTMFRDNYDVAENHNFSHGMEVDSWQIASLLKPGNNTIRIEFENDPAAQTQYWIKEIMLKN